MTNSVTAKRLRKLLHYDPNTGALHWRIGKANAKAGSNAGGLNDQGYILLRVDRKALRAHRVAWAIVTGTFPKMQIDHINGNRSDNRWCNLREASHSQNHQNMKTRKDSTHGFRGVMRQPGRKLWRARLTVNHVRIHLGYFKTPEEAYEARRQGELKYFTHYPPSSRQS